MQDPNPDPLSHREREREKLYGQWSDGTRPPEAVNQQLDRMAKRGGLSQARSRAKAGINQAARNRDEGRITPGVARERAGRYLADFSEFAELAKSLNLI